MGEAVRGRVDFCRDLLERCSEVLDLDLLRRLRLSFGCWLRLGSASAFLERRFLRGLSSVASVWGSRMLDSMDWG